MKRSIREVPPCARHRYARARRTRRTPFFFFSSRRRHTRFDCDWSSDVCSSDLRMTPLELQQALARTPARPAQALHHRLIDAKTREECAALYGLAVAQWDVPFLRSEERRVGKECKFRWSRGHHKNNIKTRKEHAH